MNKHEIVIIYWNHGEPSSRRADMLLSSYGMTRIINNWNGKDALRPGDLALTSIKPPFDVAGARVVDVAAAKQRILGR
jgi:hypothetical protein